LDKRLYDNYVVQIVNHGSLTKAAAALGISQPALSSGLNSLEKEIGITIFNRKTTPISFTDEGKIYYEYLQRINLLTDDMNKRIDDMRGDVDKKLVVGAPVAYSDAMVADAMGKLLSENPDYRVSIKSASLSELIEMGANGEINCFVSTSDHLPGNFEKKLIKKEKLFLCVPADPAYDFLKTSTQDLTPLNGENFILLEEGLPLQKEIEQLLKTNGIKAKRKITVNQVSTAVNLTRRAVGICVASEDALANVENGKELCFYPLNDSLYGRNIYIAYDKDLVMPAACKAFIEQITTGE